MANESAGASFPWQQSLAGLLVILGTALLYFNPLTSSRPRENALPKAQSVIGWLDVDARLWQDPFDAMQNIYNKGKGEGDRPKSVPSLFNLFGSGAPQADSANDIHSYAGFVAYLAQMKTKIDDKCVRFMPVFCPGESTPRILNGVVVSDRRYCLAWLAWDINLKMMSIWVILSCLGPSARKVRSSLI